MTAGTSSTPRLSPLLRIISWGVLGCGLTLVLIIQRVDPQTAQSVLTLALAAFFLLLLIRIAAASIAQPTRRLPLLVLLTGVALWAVGSAILNGSGTPDLTKFPAPGEVFFLTACGAIACYLLCDTRRPTSTAANTWLDMVIVCGGTTCLAASVLISPVAAHLGLEGASLLLALLYPVLDVVLAVLVIGQWVLKYRTSLREIVPMLVGFGLWAAADISFVANLAGGTYEFQWLNIAFWGTGFALVTDQACRPRVVSSPPAASGRPPIAVLSAAGCAVAALAFEPAGSVRTVLLVPAIATLIAAGARMLLAVRAANRAAAAVALSLSDDLTDLPNRRALYLRLEQRFESGARHALMIMDLDGFKDINDTLGHSAGDRVLCEVGSRARAAVDEHVLVARLGGDEFALLADTDDEIELHEIAHAVLAAIRSPLIVSGIRLTVDASIGIAKRSIDDTETSGLMRRADVAMYDAKQARLGVVLYDPATDRFSRERLALGDDLRQAIGSEQIELWFQPQYDTAMNRVRTLEALVRWQHPEQGLLNPVEFLPIARRLGLMPALSEQIGDLALDALAEWRRDGHDVRVAINCGAPELMGGMFLPGLAVSAAAAGVSTSDVVVEVTEDSFMAEPERARALLRDVRDLGFEISVDDYGTGFSSLSYLRDLPIHEIKLDRSFVATMRTDRRSELIVASTVRLADALELRLVAEGVEDRETADDLIAMGAHVLQGYHLSRPLPRAAARQFLADGLSLHLLRSRVERPLSPLGRPRHRVSL